MSHAVRPRAFETTRGTFQLGKYWLERLPTSSKWYRTHYEPSTGQNVRVSLRTDSFQEAAQALATFAAINPTADRKSPDVVRLHDVLAWYFEHHAKKVRRAKMAALGIRFWREHFGPSTTISDLTPISVAEFAEAIQARGLTLGYASRILSVGRAALNAAHNNLIVSNVPKIKDCQTQYDREDAPPMGRPLEIAELAKLFISQPVFHIRVFMLILLNTMCRPEAALDLRRVQVMFEQNHLNLLPPGRRQNKKYRPKLPLSNTLRAILQEVERHELANAVERDDEDFKFDYYVSFRGRRLHSVSTTWHRMVERAGFVIPSPDGENRKIREPITKYSIRHTMAREMRAALVSDSERSQFLGHRGAFVSKTTLVYAPDDPRYLQNAARFIDGYMARLGEEVRRLSPTNEYSSDSLARMLLFSGADDHACQPHSRKQRSSARDSVSVTEVQQ